MGCGGSKPAASANDAAKDAAAAEIQGAAAAYMKKKEEIDLVKKQDAAAADIQGAAASYLAKKREGDSKTADKGEEGSGLLGGIVGFFSNRGGACCGAEIGPPRGSVSLHVPTVRAAVCLFLRRAHTSYH